MKQKVSSFLALRSALPPAALVTVLVVYFVLTVALTITMALTGLPILGLIGAVAITLVVLFFVRSELALPLYLIVAGPSIALSLSGSGIFSRLYIGNLLFFLVMMIWLLLKVLPNRKSGRWVLTPTLLTPLTCFIVVGLSSIVYSHLFPDPNVSYSFAHSTTPPIVTNAAEIMILIGLPMFLIIVPGVVHTLRHARWVLGAFMIIGLLYALGAIFAAPLGLYSQEVILGVQRPEVFGSVSSGLGTMLVLFASIALARALYASTKTSRLLWGAFTFIFSIGVIMTFGRESWIALFLSFITIAALYTKNWKMLIAVFMLLIPILLVTGVTNFFDPSKTYGSDRFKIWQDAIAIWQHSPYMGVGAGNYQFFDLTYGTDVVGVAHNQYLGVMAEMGVQGLICLLWILIAVGRVCVKSFRTAKTQLGKSTALAYLGFFAAIIFGGFFTDSFIPSAAAGGGTAPFVSASYRWLLLGLVLSVPNWEKEAEADEQQAPKAGLAFAKQTKQEAQPASR